MKRKILTLVLAMLLALSPFSLVIFQENVWAATTQNVTVNATPAYVSISNSPATYDFGTISASTSPNTGADYFTITNSSTVNMSVSINCTGWASGDTTWTYGAPGEDTGRLMSSTGEGGSGGSTGSGNYDIEVTNSGQNTLAANVTSVTNPQWELELEAPTSYTDSDEQTTTVTLEAVAD